LTAQRVLEGALALADEIGIDDLTIRRLADSLDVKPMTIYHHVANKEAIIDGMVDLVFAEIDDPDPTLDWKEAVRGRCVSARAVLGRHPWAVRFMESRTTPGPATLSHHDAVLGCLRRAMSLEMTAHAYALLDAYVYGFALQEQQLPFETPEELENAASELVRRMPPDAYPHLREVAAEHAVPSGSTYADEFAFGLELILGGLERLLVGAEPPGNDESGAAHRSGAATTPQRPHPDV
jgi:AcrR family transcriptional regulator